MSKTTHINPVTGRPFKDENVPDLAHALQARRFTTPQWATFQQWKGTGRLVRKGETGVTLTGQSGFQWRVFNVAQTEAEQTEAARVQALVSTPAPAPAAPAPSRKATSSRAGVKTVSGARGAPAVTKQARSVYPSAHNLRAGASAKVIVAAARQLYVDGSSRPVVVVDNANPKRTPRMRIRQAPGKHGGLPVGQIDPLQPLPMTRESIASVIRLNRYLELTEGEARELIIAFPGRHYFDPDEVASIYGTGPAATASEQGRHRVSEAKRWRALWERKSKTTRKLGALKTWAWLVFTGRAAEASAYIKRANARQPGRGPAGNDTPDTE